MARRLFLGILGFIFCVYGAVCFVDPIILQSIVGVSADNSQALTELRAMYGGVQIGIGLFYCIAAVVKDLSGSAVVLHCVLFCLVVVTRTMGILIDDGIWLPLAETGSYNASALWLFEIPVLAVGLYFWVKQ